MDGAQTTDQIAMKAAEFGMEAVALTDHGRAGGLLEFKKSCEKYKVKPIYGFEAYISPFSRTYKEKLDDYKNSSHMVVLAKNKTGVRNIFKLSSSGWTEGFYHRPRIDMDLLERYKEGLIVTGGCGSGFMSQMILTNRIEEAVQRAKRLREIFGDDFYIEVQNHGLDWQVPLKKALFEISADLSIPIVACQDSHYSTREDAELHKYITRLAAGTLEFEGNDSYFKTYADLAKMFEPHELGALERTNEVAKKCEPDWEFGKTIWPVYGLPQGETPAQKLRELATEGFNILFSAPTQEYKDRLQHELNVIEKLDFPTYFLVVADLIKWANDNGISTGPGRGSGAGSIVCYCLGITQVDPIKYELYFERFLNPARISNPDLDLDFDPRGRKDVMQYVYDKYGHEKCAQIGTYSVFKPKGSLRDFARVCGFDPIVGTKLAELVPPSVAGKTLTFEEVIKAEPKILKTEYPQVVDLARKAEKMRNKSGVHAAGILISNSDLSFQVPLFLGKSKEVASQFDMHDVEEVGLVKYDFLGLKTLTVIQDTIGLVKKRHNVVINIASIDVEDQEVYKNIFQNGRLEGIFQFENSSGFKDLCIRVKPDCIEDLSAITALFRPGPLGTKDEEGKSMVDQYAESKALGVGKYFLPELEPVLKNTYGTIAYQEQIMRICTDLASYTLPEADNMRKIIGKKLPEKMKLEREKFVSGCVTANIPESKANKLFDDIEGFAMYSFNKSHSVAYSIVSYRTAWLKHYYPIEFYTAVLNNADSNKDQAIKYIHACREDGITLLPPSINLSEMEFTIKDGSIVFGLSGVKGIAEKGGADLVTKRRELEGFETLQQVIDIGINKSVLIALTECGALEEITELSREQLVENIEAIIDYHKKIGPWEERYKKYTDRLKEIESWELLKDGPKPRRLIEPKNKPELPKINKQSTITRKDRLHLEHKTLGFYLTGHPLDDYEGLTSISNYSISDIRDGEMQNKTQIVLPVVISKITEIRTRTGKNMANVMIEDRTGRQEATIFPKAWTKLKEKIQEEMVCVVHGWAEVQTQDDEDARSIVNVIINTIEEVEETDIVRMTALTMKLKDESEWIFYPTEKQSIKQWQEARTYINNIKRMG